MTTISHLNSKAMGVARMPARAKARPRGKAMGRGHSMADLLERLGDVSPSRVRIDPAPGAATESDVLALDAKEDRLYELIDGTLVEKGMGFWESVLALAIADALREWVIPRKLGLVVGEAGMMRLFRGHVRIPDVAFILQSQIPADDTKRKPIPNLFPDLAIEVLSASNTPREMKLKRADYFKAGTRLVWEFDPETRSATVYTPDGKAQRFRENQLLDGAPVLPGFKLSLKKLYAELPA